MTPSINLRKLLLIFITVLYLGHFIIIWTQSVDVPYRDEWQLITPAQFSDSLSLDWLFTQHNEHRIVPTKLQVWLLYKLNNWNVAWQMRINFILYGLILFTLSKFFKTTGPLLFFPFMLANLNWENHHWGFQSQFHFFLLFYMLAVLLLFNPAQKSINLVLGTLSLLLSLFSFSTGVATTAITILFFVFFKVNRFFNSKGDSRPKKELLQLLVITVLAITSLLYWFYGHGQPAGHPPLTLPHKLSFWTFLANSISFAFGYESMSLIVAFGCFLLVSLPLLILFYKHNETPSKLPWQQFVLTLGILAALSSIAIGRVSFGDIFAKGARYYEISMVLLPLAAALWSRKLMTTILFIVAFYGHLDNWSLSHYNWIYEQKLAGLKCIEQVYKTGEPKTCPQLSGDPIAGRLKIAKKANLSFYQQMFGDEMGISK